MRVERKIALALMTVFLVFGCTKSEKAINAESPSRPDKTEPSYVSDDDAVSATLVRIASGCVALTNCLYQESDRAMELYRHICDEVSTLPPKRGEKCIKDLISNVLSVPYEHLDYNKRLRALDRMWDIMSDVSWPGMGKIDRWELCILRLSRIRDTIKYAQSETNNWVTRSFIAYETENLEGYSEIYERKLAYRISPQVKPNELRHLVSEMPEKEYAIVKARFEAFLGRPIRTYEEIRQARIERIRQRDLESKRIASEQQKLEALILNDKRTGRHDAWYIGGVANTNLPETATDKPSKK